MILLRNCRTLGPTRVATLGLAALWVVLLVTVSGIKEHTWFLVAVGALGMIHNIIIAGAPRRPEWFGLPLQYRQVFAERKVIEALKAAELEYPGLGRTMLMTFFPAGPREEDGEWWKDEHNWDPNTEEKCKLKSIQRSEILDHSQRDIEQSSGKSYQRSLISVDRASMRSDAA